MGSGDLEVGSGDDEVDNDVKPSEDGELGVGAGGVTLKVPPRKRGSEDDAQEGDVFIDPRPLGVEAMGDVIRKLSEASYASGPPSRNTSAPSSHQSSMDSVLGLPPPPPPDYPHPEDLAIQLANALSVSQDRAPPSSPYDLVDSLDHPAPKATTPTNHLAPKATTPAHGYDVTAQVDSPLDMFVTCKVCGARVEQTVDAIDAHVCG
jgi:hypothetical protein